MVFLFHLEDDIKRFDVKNFENEEVLVLCERLCKRKFGALKSMLEDNHFYKSKLK